MKDLKEFTIKFVGLKQGGHLFEFQIDKTFFDAFEYDECNDAQVAVRVNMFKKPTLLEVNFQCEGVVNLNCDLSNEPYDQQISNHFDLVVKFGSAYNDDNDEILVLPHGEYELNLSQYIYELIVLALPAKRIHPGVKDGTLKSETLQRLKEMSIDAKKHEQNDTEETDPRWDELKKLLTDK